MAMEKCQVQFGLVEYRDHPPQDHTFITRVHPLTTSISKMKNYVDQMHASGGTITLPLRLLFICVVLIQILFAGGDAPEAVCCALREALNFDYRKQATKVVVLIADAPPHGLGGCTDGFPNGCPLGHDPLAIAQQMAERGITVYTVGAEPALGKRKTC